MVNRVYGIHKNLPGIYFTYVYQQYLVLFITAPPNRKERKKEGRKKKGGGNKKDEKKYPGTFRAPGTKACYFVDTRVDTRVSREYL